MDETQALSSRPSHTSDGSRVTRFALEEAAATKCMAFMPIPHLWVVLPRLGSEPARRAEAGCFATRLTGPILGKVAVPMTVDST